MFSRKVNYSIKIISPHIESGVVKKWEKMSAKFCDIDVMKTQLSTDFAEYIRGTEFTFGYIQPGNGAKGRQKPLVDSEELSTMYKLYRVKKQVVLWLKVMKSKRPLNADNPTTKMHFRSNDEGHLENNFTSASYF